MHNTKKCIDLDQDTVWRHQRREAHTESRECNGCMQHCITTSMGPIPLEKLTAEQLFNELTLLRNLRVHYRLHKSPPLAHILSQMNPVVSPILFLRPISLLFSHLSLCLPTGLFSSDLPTKAGIHLSPQLCVLHSVPIPFSLNCTHSTWIISVGWVTNQ